MDVTSNNYRLGIRHSFSPNSILLGNFAYNKLERKETNLSNFDPGVVDLPPPDLEISLDAEEDDQAYVGELQHIFRSEYAKTVVGGGHSKTEQKFKQIEDVSWPGTVPPTFIGSFGGDQKLDIDHDNLYLYSYLNFLKNLTFTVGASGDHFKENDKADNALDFDKNKFDPKLGVTWNPISAATLRGAVFKTFRRLLVNGQTVEPTVGLSAIALSPGIAESEQVLIIRAQHYLPGFLYVIFAGALVSAILSTVDSALLVSRSLLAHNLVLPLLPAPTERTKLRVNRAAVAGFGVLAYMLALSAQSVYHLVSEASAFGGASVFVAMTFGLFTRIGGARSAVGAVLAGVTTYVLGAYAFGMPYPFLTSLAASALVYLGVAVAERAFDTGPAEPA